MSMLHPLAIKGTHTSGVSVCSHFMLTDTLQVGDGVFEVLSTSGDTHLGGDDFDRRIVDFLADDFQRGEGIDLRKDRQALQRLTEAAEKAKMELSTLSQVIACFWWPSQHHHTDPASCLLSSRILHS